MCQILFYIVFNSYVCQYFCFWRAKDTILVSFTIRVINFLDRRAPRYINFILCIFKIIFCIIFRHAFTIYNFFLHIIIYVSNTFLRLITRIRTILILVLTPINFIQLWHSIHHMLFHICQIFWFEIFIQSFKLVLYYFFSAFKMPYQIRPCPTIIFLHER